MKPSIPQGTRDFASETLRKRRYIIETIRKTFELYGFEPLETPSMENLETLMGKYGDEGDKLIFKILNNGLDHPSKRETALQEFEQILAGKNNKNITERALRYDLTIPFARFMAMNQGKLTLPFKRYQVQPVWRADRPQKGRYREFMQCDADVAGTYSLIADAELAELYADVFEKLKLDVEIKINNRKILGALAEVCDAKEQMTAITVAIDKLDKIGFEKVEQELLSAGIADSSIRKIEKYIQISGTNEEKIKQAEELLGATETGKKGLEELQNVLSFLKGKNDRGFAEKVVVDFTLARGLNYYTGTIYEVKAKNVQMGSIGGGGRYDDLTGLFGVPNVPGVGISFGLDRIYDVLDELQLFPGEIAKSTEVLFFNLGKKESQYAFSVMQQLREANISCELYYEEAKMDKQFKYATRKNIAFAVIIGSKEMAEGKAVIKRLSTGDQQTISVDELKSFFNK